MSGNVALTQKWSEEFGKSEVLVATVRMLLEQAGRRGFLELVVYLSSMELGR